MASPHTWTTPAATKMAGVTCGNTPILASEIHARFEEM